MSSLPAFFRRQWRLARRIQRDLWDSRGQGDGGWLQFLRVLAIVYRGVFDNGLFSRAASLSYSSLLAFGPVVGIVVLLVGTFMKGDAEARIKQVIVFVAPSLEEYVNLTSDSEQPGLLTESGAIHPADDNGTTGSPESGTSTAAVDEPLPPGMSEQEVNTALDELIQRIIEGVQGSISGVSSAGGGVAVSIGGLILIWIGISLLVAIEGAFNNIWGVREGRSWGSRIVIYWAVLSLGALLGFAAIGFLSASTVAGVLDAIPIAGNIQGLLAIVGPLVSFVALTILLTAFYKFFPNTHVRARPALVGGVIVAFLLMANNFVSILYINKVIQIQSLYGSVGIIVVLMFGLYLFWVFLLLGGQITYAMQNVSFLANQRAWNNISLRTRETITFAAFILTCRRFAAQLPPLSADEIADKMRVPNNIINESLNRLTHLDLLMPVRGREDDHHGERSCFVPARPLKRISLASFKQLYSSQGSNEGTDLVRKIDPLVETFRQRLDRVEDGELGAKTIDELLDEHPAEPPLLPREIEQKKQESDCKC